MLLYSIVQVRVLPYHVNVWLGLLYNKRIMVKWVQRKIDALIICAKYIIQEQ